MGCFQTRDTADGWCGMPVGTIKQNNETPSDAATEESKSGQKPSEVLRLSQDVTSGLLKTYQKVLCLLNAPASRQNTDERNQVTHRTQSAHVSPKSQSLLIHQRTIGNPFREWFPGIFL